MDKKRQNSFVRSIEEHKGIIFKVVHSYCRNNSEKQDLTQEVLMQLWRSFESYDNRFKFTTWMYRVALNVAISFYRKNEKEQSKKQYLDDTFADIELVAEDIEQDGDLQLLYKFIGELSSLDKAVMILFLENENYRNIATHLGLTETNVATKVARIKEKLKIKFNKAE